MLPAVEQLLLELARRKVGLTADGDRLRYSPRSAMTPELVVRLKEHKAAVLAIVQEAKPCEHGARRKVGDQDVNCRAEQDQGASTWESAIDPPPPCPKCGSLELWWNLLGDTRCMKCDPPTVSIKPQEHATKIRHR